MSVWKKTKLMLGLAADEEYDDAYDTGLDVGPGLASEDNSTPQIQPTAVSPGSGTDAFSSPVVARPTPRAATPPPTVARSKQRSVVRPIPAATNVKPHITMPTSFNDAQEIGEKYRSGQPVAMDLHELDRDSSRRLIDFASGLCFGLGGRMEKIVDHIYLLTPTDVEVLADERKRLRDRGLNDD